MKKQIIKDDDIFEGTFGPMRRVPDFFPRPEDLVFKNPPIKVTIALDHTSVDFFKKEAKRLNTSYQRMIRNLLHEYVTRMTQSK